MKQLVLAICLLATCVAGAKQELPVFLADNHAETFGWIARNFDPDVPCVMVLVDAHSDASAAERSEEIREQLRRSTNEAQRDARIAGWRTDGRLQAFNWIEPLMPRPLDHILWLAAPELAGKEAAARSKEAGGLLDGRLEIEPRSAGSLGARWDTCDLAGYAAWNPGRRPVILAIDLDFFAGMDEVRRLSYFETIWERAMDWPGLRGVAFAVSRPWLTDDAEAEALVAMAVDAVRHTRGARLEMARAVDASPDASARAAELAGSGKAIPRWDLGRIRRPLAAKLALLEGTEARAFIAPVSGEIDTDEVWRFHREEEPALRLEPDGRASGRVRWYALEPARTATDLLPDTGLGKGFSTAPSRWIYEKRRSLGETTDFQLAPSAWANPSGGRMRIEADYETDEGWISTAPIEIRVQTSHGFRGALSECMGMPYVFGVAGVREGDLSGVDTGWGSDCSNLLIHAWRRNGVPLSWGDPGRLRAQLVTRASKVRLEDAVAISQEEIENGLAIDFGKHVAAVWEDREPLGALDGNDLAIHHLGGRPEILPLARLVESRPMFSLLVPPPVACTIAIAGDVVLAGEERTTIERFEKEDSDLFLANLEGVPSMLPPTSAPRFDFRFPPERLAWLREQGIDAVSLANNHAADAGGSGLLEGLAALHKKGIGVFGAGRDPTEACRPWRIERKGVKIAVFGISCFEEGDLGGQAAIASIPRDTRRLEEEFREARRRGERIVVMIHWGREYSREVDAAQRETARWLVSQGAKIVAGAHPHVIQREESHAGTRIHYSLGNAVYPKALRGADSGELRRIGVRR